MTQARRWMLNLLLFAGSSFLVLMIAEMAVRIGAPQPTGLSHQDRYGLAMHYPGITRYLPQYGHSVTFNRAGMRDREHQVAKPDSVYRILLLGDSFMEALQVPFDSTLAALLEGGLPRIDGRHIEVINSGVSGWGTDDELRYLTEYGVSYHPDLVLLALTLHNDVSDNLRQTWHRMGSTGLVAVLPPPIPWLTYQELQLKAFLGTRLQLYQLWRRVRHGREIRQTGRALRSHITQLLEAHEPEGIRQGWRLTGAMMAAMDSVASRHGARFAMVLLPLRVQLSDSSFAEFGREADLPPDSLQLDRPQARALAIADSLHIPAIDLLPGFRAWVAAGGAPLFLEWDGHWNAAGHRLAAELTVTGLEQAGFRP